MQDKIAEEVQKVLTTNPEDISFEQIQGENSSPLNQPVVEKDIGGERPTEDTNESWNVWKPGKESAMSKEPSGESAPDFRKSVEEAVEHEKRSEPLDAPEQEINGAYDKDEGAAADEYFEVPLKQANQAADALLGMTNNVMEVGGGYFVKIKKHKEFYEFDEIVQVIDQQNDKNLKRIRLDDEDKALLRPLLAQVLQKKAKKLTPEQQLMGAIVSILMRKAQVVMEVRAENLVLEERILDIVREEKGYVEQDNIEDGEEVVEDDNATSSTGFVKAQPPKKPEQEPVVEEIEVEEVGDDTPETTILDVAKEVNT